MKKTGYLGGTITVSGAAVSGASVVVTNATGAAVSIADRLPAGTYTITITKTGYLTYTKEVTLKDKEDLVVEADLEKKIEVDSVKALNLKEVEITFTKALTYAQRTEAEDEDNYTVTLDGANTKTTVKVATVSEDGKSVILLLDGSAVFEQGKKANEVTVSKKLGMEEDYATKTVASDDIAVPQITNVEAVGNKVIKVTFSEAVDAANVADLSTQSTLVYTLDDGTSTAYGFSAGDKATVSTNKRTVTIELTTPLSAGKHKLAIANAQIKDFAGYAVPAATKEFNVAEASTVSQATSVEVKDRTTVYVNFNGPVSASGTLKWEDASKASGAATSPVQVDSDTLKYTFTSALPIGDVTFTVSAVTDAFGNPVPQKELKGTVKADETIDATLEADGDDGLIVKFSAVVDKASAEKLENYVLTKNGTEESLTGVTATLQSDNKTVKINKGATEWDLAGTYTLTIKNVKNSYGDTIPTLAKTITVTDATRPTVINKGSYSTGSHKISVTFNEEMTTSGANSITNSKNYLISEDTGATYKKLSVAYPEAVLTASADGKSVIITLPDTETVKNNVGTLGKVLIKVGELTNSGLDAVADKAGNVIDVTSSNVVNISADVAASISTQKVLIKDANSIYVATDNTLGVLATAVASDFEYTVDGANWEEPKSAELTTVGAANAQYIKLGISETLSANTDSAKIQVRTKALAANVKYKSATALGTPIATVDNVATVSTYSKKFDPTTDAYPFKTAIKSATVIDSEHVRIVFDGNVGNVAGGTNPLDSVLQIVNDSNTYQGYNASLSGSKYMQISKESNNTVIAKLDNNALDTTKATIVKTAYNSLAANVYPVDANGAYYVDNTTGVTADRIDNKLAVTTFADDFTNGVVADGNTIIINFSQAVDASTIVSNWDGSSTQNVVANVDTSGNLTLTVAGETVNFGTISGFTAKTAGSITTSATLRLDSDTNKKLTLTFTALETTNAVGNVLVNTSLVYTPGNGIKSKTGSENIVATPVSAKTANFAAPVLYSVETSADHKTIVATFSEGLDASTVVKSENSVKITPGTDCKGVIDTVVVNGNKVTITLSEAATDNDSKISFGTDIKDAQGTGLVAVDVTASSGAFTK